MEKINTDTEILNRLKKQIELNPKVFLFTKRVIHYSIDKI